MKHGIAIDLKTNQWVETASLSDDDLAAALHHGPMSPWPILILAGGVALLLWLI